jgi:DNA-binding GntR family transcriptional regulator
MRSIAEILDEVAYRFLDLSCEHVFFKTHLKILKLVSDRKARDAMKLVREDILDVRRRLSKALQRGNMVRTLSPK